MDPSHSVLRLALEATDTPMNRENHKATAGKDVGRMIGENKASLNLAGQLTGQMRGQMSKLEMHLAGAEVQQGFAEPPPQHVWVEGFLDPKDKDELKALILESMKEKSELPESRTQRRMRKHSRRFSRNCGTVRRTLSDKRRMNAPRRTRCSVNITTTC